MQQRQEQRFNADQQYVHLFPQDGMRFQNANDASEDKWQRKRQRDCKRKKHRILSWWNLFAVIGVITVIIQTLRYLIIPLLVYLNSMIGGAL